MSSRILRSAKTGPAGVRGARLQKSIAAERLPSDCWHEVLCFLPRGSLEICEMSCRKLRTLTAKSHTTAESPSRRLCIRILYENSTFTVKIAEAYSSFDWLSIQTCNTVPELMRMLERCMRAHVVVDRLILNPQASAKLASHSGRLCKNIRLEARVEQLRMAHVPFSSPRGRETFFSMFGSLEAVAFEQHYDNRFPAVQISGDDLRMLTTMKVSGLYLSPLMKQPSIAAADIMCFLFDRADAREDIVLQLREPNIDETFVNELVERHLACNHTRPFTLTLVDPCEQRVDHRSIKPRGTAWASPPLLSDRWAGSECQQFEVDGAEVKLSITYRASKFLTVYRTSANDEEDLEDSYEVDEDAVILSDD